ncbi:unnamed protein product, partial [Didymodactylos carnosus]
QNMASAAAAVAPNDDLNEAIWIRLLSEVLVRMSDADQAQVTYDEDLKLWLINISICDEGADSRLKAMVDYIRSELRETTDLVDLADLFVKMGEYDTAKVYYQRQLSLAPVSDRNMKRA